MSAFSEVVRFECRYQLRSPLFVAVALAYGFVHFMAALRAGINIGLQSVDASRLALNATYSIIQNEAVLSVFGMFPALVFVASAITRDHERKAAESFFAAPITPRTFFFGRFFGGLVAAVLVGIAGLAGTLAALAMPGIDSDLLDPFSLAPYAFSLVVIILPNTLIVCAMFYGVAALTRSMGAAFAALLVLLAAAAGFGLNPDSIALIAILEPTGVSALIADTRYWTGAELASRLPTGWVVVNRAVWLAIALAVLSISSWCYRFRLDGPRLRWWPERRSPEVSAPRLRVVEAVPRFGTLNALRQLRSLLRMDLRSILLSIPFYVVLALSIQGAFSHFSSEALEVFQGNRTVPVTSLMLDYFRFGMIQTVFLVVVYYSGQLVHGDRQFRIAGIVDASPFPDGLSVVSRVLALCLVVTAMLLVTVLTFVLLQAATGYTNFELGLYAEGVFGISAFNYYMLCVLAVLIQIISPGKWIGMLFVIVVFVGSQVARFYGFQHGLYGFEIPYVPHTDMNGYGDFAIATASFVAYWAAFCALLIIVGHLLYPRGLRDKLSHWALDLRARTSRRVIAATGLACLIFVGTGSWIFYNTNILNDYASTRDLQAAQAEYERLYDRFSGRAGPQATAVDLQVDIFPDERRVESRGRFRLVNAEDASVDELPVFINPELVVRELTVAGADLVESNARHGFYLFRFDESLSPGTEVTMDWDLSWLNRGFRNGIRNYRVISNGTYLETLDILPHGYDSDRELTDDNVRRRYGLPPADRLPGPDEPRPPNALRAAAAVPTEVRTVVSTSPDQIALAPGSLVREWTEGDRRYFEYGGGGPGEPLLWPALMIGSARYAVARDDFNGVPIEVYYDPGHPYAIETMLRTARQALDYYSREFGPYQYDSYRMFEIPRYHTFARASAGVVAYSESIGFLGRFDEVQVDFTTAHELAHQWWGAQLMGANMLGTSRLNETLANYSALMLIREIDGDQAAYRLFMDLRDDYLRSRGFEPGDGGEAPLIRADSLKGHLALFTLQDLLGADRIHLALRQLLDDYSYLERFNSPPPPFPSSIDFVDEIRSVADDRYQPLITDLYERVTFYDVRVTGASSRPVDGGFEVTIDVAARQIDATGDSDVEVPLSAYFDVAVFAPSDDGDPLSAPLYLEKHLLESGTQTFRVLVDSEPALVGIDPYGKMIDLDIDDNVSPL